MKRTTIVLPEPLKRRSIEKARAEGVSFAEFVRRAVEVAITEPPSHASQRKRLAAWEAMRTFREEAHSAGPADLAKNLDDYIYGIPVSESTP
ncbi:MAG: CopG family transcriptional regulator [Verrucomicrobiales bacterium]